MSPTTISLGCRLNAAEADMMAGHAITSGRPDAVIINSCAVTNEAVRQSRQAVRRAVREHQNRPIIVTGCAAQIDPKTFAQIEGVTQVIGNREKMNASSFAANAPKLLHSDILQPHKTQSNKPAAPTNTHIQNRSRAIVQIQNGCDHRCTFCIIPYGRGNSTSVPVAECILRVKKLRDEGYNEIVLSGVDISSYGHDLQGEPSLGSVVGQILSAVPDLPRLRLSSIDSAEIDDELFDLIASEPRLAPYLHLSLQHGDNLILKRMKRRHDRGAAISLCQNLRRVRPDISFGADLIAGFPTEDEAMFENSLALIDECDLSWVHVFPFSARTGTPAARMPQLNGAIIKERAARLRAKAATAKAKHLKTRAHNLSGIFDLALIENTKRTDGLLGRLADFTPIHLPPKNIRAGSLHVVRITGYEEQALIGDFRLKPSGQ